MIDTEEQEVVECVLPKRSDEAFDVGRCIGCAVRDRQPLDSHCIVQPPVQVTSIAAPPTVLLEGHWLATLTEDAFVVVHEETRNDVVGGCFSDLLLHPRQRRIAGDVDVHDPPRADLHDNEDIGDGEERGVLGEEVADPPTIHNLNDLVVGPQELNLRTAAAITFSLFPLDCAIVGNGTLARQGPEGRRPDAHAYILIQVGTTAIEEAMHTGRSTQTLIVDATPNPFTLETSLSFQLPSNAYARMSVHDVLGRRIVTLSEGAHAAGRHALSWTGKDDAGSPVPTGVYMVRLEFNGGIHTKKARSRQSVATNSRGPGCA